MRIWTLSAMTSGDPSLHPGMVIRHGAKMSKSKGNVFRHDEMIARYGADATRMYALLRAPPDRDLEGRRMGCWESAASRRVYRLGMPLPAIRCAALPAAGTRSHVCEATSPLAQRFCVNCTRL